MLDQDVLPGGAGAAPRLRFDSRIAVVLREDLATWQKLNVTAFLASGIVAGAPDVVGLPYADGSGGLYLPMFAQPVLVFAGPAAALRTAFERALARNIRPSIYTDELFATDNDADNRAAVRAVRREALRLAGFAFRAPRREADKVLKGLSLHP
ncbi:MAG: DUF2000 family protein [Rhodospirillaceae bacterium]|nr:DUF2000 family protein [Rhodospirillaceae bacterium]